MAHPNAGGVAIPPPQLKQLSLKCWKTEKPYGVREFLPNFNSWKVKPSKQVYSCHINQKYILFINKDQVEIKKKDSQSIDSDSDSAATRIGEKNVEARQTYSLPVFSKYKDLHISPSTSTMYTLQTSSAGHGILDHALRHTVIHSLPFGPADRHGLDITLVPLLVHLCDGQLLQ